MENSGLNTFLLVIIIALLGFGAWWFISNQEADNSAQIELTLPNNSQ